MQALNCGNVPGSALRRGGTGLPSGLLIQGFHGRASRAGASLRCRERIARGGEPVFGCKPVDEPAEITNRGELADDALP